jgi:4-amino-4-deoxy-L-arabinose transferase-like glycosyltransferase
VGLVRVGPLTWDLGLLLVLALAVGVRLAFASAPVFLEGDSQSYLLPGWELANGQGFSPELRRTPLYPLFVAASLALFGQDLTALALAQQALGLATVGLVYVLGARLFGRGAGLLAALAMALSGPQLVYERYVMTEALFGLALAGLGVVLVAAVQPQPGHSADLPTLGARGAAHGKQAPQVLLLPLLAGLAIGVAALTRPVAQAILPLLLLALLLGLPRWRPALKAAGLALVGYVLLVGPWAVRNALAHDSLSASGGLGRSLIARAVKYDTLVEWKWLSETYQDREDRPARARMLLYSKRGNIVNGRSVRPYQDALVRDLGLSQGEADRLMREVALESIARRPLDYLVGSLRFTGMLFLGSEERLQSHWKQRANKDWAEQWDNRLDPLVTPVAPWSGAPATSQAILGDLVGLYQPSRLGWLVVGLFLAGCCVAARGARARPALLLAGICLSLLALSAFLDGPVVRYRHPVDPLISVLAAGGLVGGLRAAASAARRWRRPDKDDANLSRPAVVHSPATVSSRPSVANPHATDFSRWSVTPPAERRLQSAEPSSAGAMGAAGDGRGEAE